MGAHLEKLRELRDEARQRGQLSAATQAEVKRGEARRFEVNQVESGEAGEFDCMTDEELREFIYGQEKILATLSGEGGKKKRSTMALHPTGRWLDAPDGQNAFVSGVDLIEMMRSRMGNLRLLWLYDGSGHWVQHERPRSTPQFLTKL